MSSFKAKHGFIPVHRQEIDEEDRQAVDEVLKSGVLSRGEKVEAFEEAFAKYVGAPYAVTFSTGATALWGAALSLDITPFDQLVASANACLATAKAFTREGASFECVDIDPKTGVIDLEKTLVASKKARSRGRTLYLPNHFGGNLFDVKEFDNRLEDRTALIIENGADALGDSYPNGLRVGSCEFSDMTIFSFVPSRAITTGEGGMVSTYSKERYERLKKERDGFNLRMTEMQAALGISQLKKIDRFIEKKKTLVAFYAEKLKELPSLKLLHTPQMMVIRIPFGALKIERNNLMNSLKGKGIETKVQYPPLYRQEPYQHHLPLEQMEEYEKEALTLPLFTEMEEEDVHYIIDNLKNSLR